MWNLITIQCRIDEVFSRSNSSRILYRATFQHNNSIVLCKRVNVNHENAVKSLSFFPANASFQYHSVNCNKCSESNVLNAIHSTCSSNQCSNTKTLTHSHITFNKVLRQHNLSIKASCFEMYKAWMDVRSVLHTKPVCISRSFTADTARNVFYGYRFAFVFGFNVNRNAIDGRCLHQRSNVFICPLRIKTGLSLCIYKRLFLFLLLLLLLLVVVFIVSFILFSFQATIVIFCWIFEIKRE